MSLSSQAITDVAIEVQAIADKIETSLAALRTGDLPDTLRYYAAFKSSYDNLDAQRKRLYEQVESLSRKTIPEMMAEKDIKTISLADIGYRFTVQQRFSVSMPDKDAGMEWLRANGMENLIQETVNAGTLTSAAKQRIEKEGLDMPTDLFNQSYMAVTSMTKV